jgi:putative nucleotidyltransferase with HDIG domain
LKLSLINGETELEDINERNGEISLILVETIINVINAGSIWTKGHAVRVSNYAVQIAKEMGFSDKEIMILRLAGLLHDIGEIGTSDKLLSKVSITEKEYEIIKEHPVHGAKIFEKIEQLKDIAPLIRHHHERVDGKGYPDSLNGEETPLSARILHVAESFDSMTSDRPHRLSPGIEYALSELKKHSGSQFDSRVVDAFLKISTLEE